MYKILFEYYKYLLLWQLEDSICIKYHLNASNVYVFMTLEEFHLYKISFEYYKYLYFFDAEGIQFV